IHDLKQLNIGVFARECMANGFLSGMFTETTKFPLNSLNARYSQEELKDRIQQVEAFSFLKRNETISMPQAAQRWILDQPGVSTVLSGAKNITELKEAVAGSETKPYSIKE